MLTTTSPMAQKNASSTSRGCSVAYSHHRQLHEGHRDHESVPPQPQPQQQPQSYEPSHLRVDGIHGNTQDPVSSISSELPGMFSRSLPNPLSPEPSPEPSLVPSEHQSKRQSKLHHHFRPNDNSPSQDGLISPIPVLDFHNPKGVLNCNGDTNGYNSDERRFVVRLDLRKLGVGIRGTRDVKKPSIRQPPKQRSTRNAIIGTGSSSVQTTLSASSWSIAKKNIDHPDHPDTLDTTSHSMVDKDEDKATISIPEAIINLEATSSNRPSRQKSPTAGEKRSILYEEDPHTRSDDDEDYIDNGSQAAKRRNSSRNLRNSSDNKRARIQGQDSIKKKKGEEIVKKQRQEVMAVKKEPSKKLSKNRILPHDISITGDEHALKNPPPDCQPGIFKQLLDNLNRCNPKVFVLPDEIKSFFRGVTAGSDGEYEDILEHKPSVKQSSSSTATATTTTTTTPTTATSIRSEENALLVHDAQGEIRLCFHCNKSTIRGKLMISCDHCPLHWHLDCLSPPMASPPPSTRKWMCPNHAEHVSPRRRKRKDAVPIQVDDPEAPNDGVIEVIPDYPSILDKKSIWDTDTSGIMYKIPERSIKLSFIEKCRKIRESIAEARLNRVAQDETLLSEHTSWRFNLLVAAVMANEHHSSIENSTGLSNGKSQMEGEDIGQVKSGKEKIQDSVLEHLTDPEQRQEYLRFKAFQQYIRENSVEGTVKEWLSYHEREKERIASQVLLNL
ncbi:hypothetical protein BGZ76_010942 [Entomortierella beljakovae]|nr:hypothetical protein BGZ76_010942 [Entomortierella beljakovae]